MDGGDNLEEIELASEQANEPLQQPITQRRVHIQTEQEEPGSTQESDSSPEVPGHQYGTARLNDPTVINALKNVRVVEGVDTSSISIVYPYFTIKNSGCSTK